MACDRPEFIPNACGVRNPLKDLPWLADAIAKSSDVSVTQAGYQGQIVYVLSSCGRCFAGPNVTIYRCDGTSICNGMLMYGNPSPACKTVLDTLTDNKVLLEKNE